MIKECYRLNSNIWLFFSTRARESIKANTLIECPECKAHIKANDWGKYDLPCETCGDHAGIKCPECDEFFDCVYDDNKLRIIEK